MSNQEKYDHIFCEVFAVDVSQLGDHFTFKDIGVWDSVAHLNLISELEDTFEVMFETEDILHFGSYINGINILRRYGVEI